MESGDTPMSPGDSPPHATLVPDPVTHGTGLLRKTPGAAAGHHNRCASEEHEPVMPPWFRTENLFRELGTYPMESGPCAKENPRRGNGDRLPA